MKVLALVLILCMMNTVFFGCVGIKPEEEHISTDEIELVNVTVQPEPTPNTSVTTEVATETAETTAESSETTETTAVTVAVTSETTVATSQTTVVTSETTTAETLPPEPVQVGVMVPVLMFHDVKSYPGGTWSMSADNFRKTMEFLLDNGFTPVSFSQLVDYVDGMFELPEKPVCITLDDGYYSNYKNVLPIITELKIPITVFMTCRTVRAEGIEPSPDESLIPKMNAEELAIMEASPFVHIQSHTYGLHGRNVSYSEEERNASLPLESESEADFKKIYAKDCSLAEKVLSDVGVTEHLVLSYPGGKYHEWTEDVLRERGYRVTVTTEYGHRNFVVKGDPDSLYLLGRMNVNDDTTEEGLLKYLERK